MSTPDAELLFHEALNFILYKMNKTAIFWTVAVIITLSSAIYQRYTGPTHPKRVTVTLDDEESWTFRLIRSHDTDRDFFVTLNDAPASVEGEVVYRRYPTDDEWTRVRLEREGKDLFAQLPVMPAAGKLEYYLVLESNEERIKPVDAESVIIRFKDPVPAGFLVPHIIFMFVAMLLSNLTGLMALFNDKRFRRYSIYTLVFLIAGGMILGPIIQKYAFGDLWTGFPLGGDLTDNKTLVSVIAWIGAIAANRKKERRWTVILAAVILLIVYFIPHSMMGSELDYETGEVITG